MIFLILPIWYSSTAAWMRPAKCGLGLPSRVYVLVPSTMPTSVSGSSDQVS